MDSCRGPAGEKLGCQPLWNCTRWGEGCLAEPTPREYGVGSPGELRPEESPLEKARRPGGQVRVPVTLPGCLPSRRDHGGEGAPGSGGGVGRRPYVTLPPSTNTPRNKASASPTTGREVGTWVAERHLGGGC